MTVTKPSFRMLCSEWLHPQVFTGVIYGLWVPRSHAGVSECARVQEAVCSEHTELGQLGRYVSWSLDTVHPVNPGRRLNSFTYPFIGSPVVY